MRETWHVQSSEVTAPLMLMPSWRHTRQRQAKKEAEGSRTDKSKSMFCAQLGRSGGVNL